MTSDPALRAPVLPRQTLLQSVLRLALRHRLTMITAPPGYGKSTLLHMVQTGVSPQAVLVCVHADDKPLEFLAALHAALGFPALPADLALRLALHVTLEMLRESAVQRASQTLLLLIDDLDAAPTVQHLFFQLVEQSPANFHFAVSTNDAPASATLARLQAEDEIGHLRVDDLRISGAETVDLLASVLGRTPPQALVEHVNGWMGGWLLGVRVTASVLAGSTPPDKPLELTEIEHIYPDIMRLLAAFLDEDVMRHQPPAQHAFLLISALGETVDAALCTALGCKDAHPALDLLQRQALFLQPQPTPDSPVKYLPVFRTYLRTKLATDVDEETLRQMHRQAAAHYLAQADETAAMNHLLAALEYAQAATLLPALYTPALLVESRSALRRWVMLFPHNWRSSDPWLLLLAAHLEAQEGDPDRADDLYAQACAASTATTQSDAALQQAHFIALRERADWLRQCGRYHEAERLCAEALTLAPDNEQRALVLAIEARCVYMHGGNSERALSIIDRALGLARVRTTTVRIVTIQAMMCVNCGDFAGALESYSKALAMKTQLGQRLRSTLANIAFLHMLRGELDLAEAAAQHARSEAVSDTAMEMVAYADMVLGMVALQRGQFDAARARFHSALTQQRQIDNQAEIAVLLDCLSQLAASEQDFPTAIRYGEQSLSIRRSLGVVYEIGLAQITLGRGYALVGDLEKAHSHWSEALATFTAAGARYEQAQLHFYLAWLHTAAAPSPIAEDKLTAYEHLQQTLSLSARYDYRRLFVNDVAWAVPVLVSALRWNINTKTAIELMTALGSAGTPLALASLLSFQDETHPAVQQAVRRATTMWLSREPLPLHVTTLGAFRLYQSEQLVTEWPRTTARLLFVYLLHHRQRWSPSDELIEVLWPDGDPDKARKNLHQASAALRHTLEPELGSGLPSRYLHVTSGSYRLHLPPGSTIDHERFTANARSARQIDELIATVALYQGDYLEELPDAEWALGRREQVRLEAMGLLGRLCEEYYVLGQLTECISAAHRLLEIEPWSEQAVGWLMRSYSAQGRREAALRVYQSFAARLHDELAILPQSELRALYQSITSAI